MRVAIVGAGFAGLVTAKVLSEFGHRVSVFERAPDVGGVWSRTRRYPGVSTQNDKGTYAFSDFPMPRTYPEWPSGAQVQAYLEAYTRHFGLGRMLALGTEVSRATPRPGGGWTLETRTAEGTDDGVHEVELLVVANGIFSDPLVPDLDGAAEFRAAGGRLCHSSEFTDLDDARGRDVVVVGYGKSACDLAVALSDVTASTTLVARRLMWKMPKRLGAVLNYKYLILTRLGESLFPYQDARRTPPARPGMMAGVQALVVRQLGLRSLGLVPPGGFADIARSTVSLATDGFYSRVARGRIAVLRDDTVVRLLVRGGRPCAELSSARVVPADVVACATGFHQRVPFLPADVQARLLDGRGNFELYRQILPLRVPDLYFAGYNSSLFSPLNAEIGALWIADHLAGGMHLPEPAERHRLVRARLRWMEERTEGQHARGTNIIPFSMHNIDEMLADIGIDVPRSTRLRQWVLPIDPGAYRSVADRLRRRHGTSPAAAVHPPAAAAARSRARARGPAGARRIRPGSR